MALLDPSRQFAERLGLMVGATILINFTFMTVAPYFIALNQQSIRLIDQQQTILQGVFLILVGFLWGNSSGNKSKDQALEAQAETIRTTAAAANPAANVSLDPGQHVKVEASDGPQAPR